MSATNIGLPLISHDNYTFLKAYILRESGFVLTDGKEYFLSTRLAPVLSQEKLPNLDALCVALRQGAAVRLRQAIVESLTIHETSFFRDETAYEALRLELLPKIAAARPSSGKIRIWSAASSSGQEPYSLAMILLEMGIDPERVSIAATDISQQILDRAGKGIYNKVEVQRGISSQRMRHFRPHPEGWQINSEIRGMVRFSRTDLRKFVAPSERYDLVICRNVLIYFDVPTKTQILKAVTETMLPGGYLLLGTAETPVNMDHLLKPVLVRGARFYQYLPANERYESAPLSSLNHLRPTSEMR